MVTPAQLTRRAQLYEQLAASLAAGLPLIQALEMASRNRTMRGSQQTILALIGHLNEGYTFADSMKKTSGWLSDFDVALLSVGEESGRLDVAFRQLARYYTNRVRIIGDAIKGSLVSVATLHVALLIFPLDSFVAFVVGIVNGEYANCLPFLIHRFIVFGSLYGTVIFLIFACGSKRGEGWRSMVEDIFGCVPMLRVSLKYFVIARLAAALDALSSAGVSAVRTWEMAAEACGSPRLKRQILHWAPQLETGVTPAEMVNQIPYFPEMFSNLYFTAEMTGKHDETLERLQVYFEQEGVRLMQWFTRIMNGIFYACVAVYVAYKVISFWKHYYDALLQSV
ncbi:MAG TPA: type II secretion system F family protein [Candidatus Acidoferrales bacterium]|jgi:type II secretory pathway component PulF|nr:type II secretion system F family protein [Candidatus Acidoferrales bacterium]